MLGGMGFGGVRDFEMKTIKVLGVVAVLGAVLALSAWIGGAGETPGEDKTTKVPPITWSDGKTPILTGALAESKGWRALAAFPPLDPAGYAYVADFKKWSAFLLRKEWLPEGIERHVLPLRMGKLTVVGGGPPANGVGGKDGFVVRYTIGDALVQLTDTRYDYRILVRDVSRKKKEYAYEERQKFARTWRSKLFHKHLVHYPDGKLRKIEEKDFKTCAFGAWNWLIRDADKDDTRSGSQSTQDPFACFAVWRTDGRTVLFQFAKQYDTARVEIPKESKASRFEYDANFHESPKPEKPKKETEGQPK
jgi:hypothetical protein